MKDDKALSLFKEIQEKTQSRKLAWEATAEEGTFVVGIKGKYTLKAFGYSGVSEGGQRFGPPSFTLYEGDEMVVDISYSIEGISGQALTDLYTSARRQALKTDEKLDEVLSELRKL